MLNFAETHPPGSGKDILTSSTLSPLSQLRPSRRRILRSLTPSFLVPTNVQNVKRPTDFLDGMRGFAAFAVFICHFYMPTHPNAHMGYGGNNGVDDYWLTQLPIIRLIWSGDVSVSIFFVISGFSISLKPLKLIRAGSYTALLDTMTSATFRRACRLYIPCLTVFAMTFILDLLGAFDFSSALTKKWPFPSNPLKIPARHSTFAQRFADWMGQVWAWSDPLAIKHPHVPYGVQLWTIPLELQCSFAIFLSVIGFARVRPTVRMTLVAALACYIQLQGHPEIPPFFAGMILAELHLIHSERFASAPARLRENSAQKTKSIMLFIFGLFLVSYPRLGASKAFPWPPFHWLATFFVADKGEQIWQLFRNIGSTLLIFVVSRSPSLQNVFTTPLARYLGHTSFALYCVHQALINWFGYRSILFFWSFTGRDTFFSYELGIGLAFLIQTIVTFWVADVFWRFVDLPSVDVTKWIEQECRLNP